MASKFLRAIRHRLFETSMLKSSADRQTPALPRVHDLKGDIRLAETVIDLAKQFDPQLKGTSVKDGPTNATAVREHLAQALKQVGGVVALDLKGLTYTPSAAWIKVAFGDLVTQDNYKKGDLLERIAIRDRGLGENEVSQMARHYIENA